MYCYVADICVVSLDLLLLHLLDVEDKDTQYFCTKNRSTSAHECVVNLERWYG